MDVFVARLPVFEGDKVVLGYELVFRSDFQDYYKAAQAHKATVDLMAFVNFNELTDGKRGFVDFSKELLMMEFPLLFSAESMIASLPADMPVDDDVLERVKDLKTRGYTIALSNFTVESLQSPLASLASIVKLETSLLTSQEQKRICAMCKSLGVKVLARGIVLPEQLKVATGLGYDYFQGEFFSKPVVTPSREIGANQLICLRLLQEVNQAELSYDKVAAVIQQDVSMTYRLLKLINSAWAGLRYEVRSVRHALVLLGPIEIKRWASLLAVNQAGQDKPTELLRLSLTRAKFAEQLALLAGMKRQAPELFLVGMFSVLDALIDQPMGQILSEVALGENVKSALLGGTGEYKVVYETMLAYEHAQWPLFADLAATMGIAESAVPDLFRQSLTWANQAMQLQ